MAVKLADAFVQITARSEGLQKDVAKQLAGLGKVGEQVGKDAGDKFAKEFDAETKDIDGTVKKSLGGLDKFAASTGQSMGSKISSGINKTLKAGVIGVGVAAGGVLATALSKGVSRRNALDQAESKLKGLGFSADEITRSMRVALDETNRRRQIQQAYNEAHGITPTTIRKAVRDLISIGKVANDAKVKLAKDPESMSEKELLAQIKQVQKKMPAAAAELNFELAAQLRDQMMDLKKVLQNLYDES